MSRLPSPTARTVAAHVVARVLDEGAWTGPALDAALKEHPLEPRDRALCAELARGTLRWCVPLEQSLRRAQDRPKKLDKRIRPHLLVAAYQLQHLQERIPARAAVHEAIEAIKRVRRPLAGLGNALLRNLGSAPHLQLRPDADLKALSDAFGVPFALAEASCEGEPPEQWRAAVAALNERAPLSLWSWASVQDALELEDALVRPHPFVPGVVLLDEGGDPGRLAAVQDGRASVMDPGSVLVGLLAHQPGRVLDLCAAPGSKSIVLASHPDTEVVAVERSPRRAERLLQNVARTHLPIEVVVGDATNPDLDVGHPLFDAVLVDAPCSALGTCRRRPDVKLARPSEQEEERGPLQAALLAAASRFVRPGGALTYAVCSPIPSEGRAVIGAFLAGPEGRAFTAVSAEAQLPWLPSDAVDDQGGLRLKVHRHEADAFFAARLTRAADTDVA